MRAVEIRGPGDLDVVERPDPEPGSGELLIAPEAVGICGPTLRSSTDPWRTCGPAIPHIQSCPVTNGAARWSRSGRALLGFSPDDVVVGRR